MDRRDGAELRDALRKDRPAPHGADLVGELGFGALGIHRRLLAREDRPERSVLSGRDEIERRQGSPLLVLIGRAADQRLQSRVERLGETAAIHQLLAA